MKKLISILFLFFSFFNITFAQSVRVKENCEYYDKYKECLDANKKWKNREITDYICRDSRNPYEIIYQIVLDEEFKKVDKLAEDRISLLEMSKDFYFWPNAKKDLIDAVDEIELDYWNYWTIGKIYHEICLPNNKNSIFKKTSSCFDWWIPANSPIEVLNSSTCNSLADTKLSVYKQISYDILKINKVQVRADSKKELSQDQRQKYDNIADLFLNNLNYLEKIWKRWPSKTKNTM